MSLFFEKNYPRLIAIILSFICYVFNEIFLIDYQSFYDTSLSVFSILIGFLLTVSTILNSLDNEAVNFIKRSDKYDLFLEYLKKSIYTSLNSLILIIFFNLFKNELSSIILFVNSFLIFYLTLALFSCYRYIRIFIQIIVR